MSRKRRTATNKSFAAISHDGFSNVIARIGAGENNLLSKGTYKGNDLTKQRTMLDAAYRESWLVGKTIDTIAEDMTREGMEITSSWEPGNTAALEKEMETLKIWGAMTEGIRWGRLYGGAIGVMLIDGQDLSTPLDPSKIARGSFRGIRIYTRHEVTPSEKLIRTPGPKLGLPVFYTINVRGEGMHGQRVHHSRCLRFIGTTLPYREAQKEQLWGASVIERTFDRIVALDSATMGMAQLVFKAHQRTVKVKNLRKILAEGGKNEKALIKNFDYVRLMQSIEGLSLFDADDTFETHNYTFAGLKDVLLGLEEQISGATGIPLVRLLGQTPGGLSSTGESDLRTYYDGIAVQQDDDLRPQLTDVLPVMSWSLFGTALPDDFSFTFPPLWKLSEVERADVASKDAQTMDNLFAGGLLTKPQALRELKQGSRIHGRFSTITDEDIEAAKTAEANIEPPTAPNLEGPDVGGSEQPGSMVPSATGGDGPTPQENSLNGAQVTSMIEIVMHVGAGNLPRQGGINMLMLAFSISREQAEGAMDEVGRTFVPKSNPVEANAPANPTA